MAQRGGSLRLGPDPTERTAFTLRLKDWPADLSAVREVLKTTTDESLRSGVVAAIGRFPKETIAEFDDSPAVLERLRVIGVHFAQGFLIHKPEPIEHLLRTWAAAH